MSVDKDKEKMVISKDDFGFTTYVNRLLQNFTNPTALGLYVYLSSLPEKWVFYKSTIRKHFSLGRDKLDNLLKILQEHSLITIKHKRNAQGKFVQTDIQVHTSQNFKIPIKNKELVIKCTPCTENQSLVNSTYKRNNNKINKKAFKSSCATDVARDRFEEFWSIFPTKKNKARARDIWKRKRYDEIAELICNDVQNRKAQDHQWQDPQYIPHPSTYLAGERWHDELTAKAPSKTKQSSGTAFSEFMNSSKTSHGVVYDESGHEFNPFN
jgi:hypothetical protein